ncbi:hypothetical protein STENM223S_10969 [Streptomyces tendae]
MKAIGPDSPAATTASSHVGQNPSSRYPPASGSAAVVKSGA